TKNATGAITSTGAFSTTGNVNLAQNITTTNTDLSIGGNLEIAEAATPTLSTGAGAGNILVSGTTNGTSGGAAESLTVLAGTGNVTFTGAVGNATNSTELEALTITSAATTSFSGALTLANALTQSAGSVATTFTGAASVGSAALTGAAFNVNDSFTSAGTLTLTGTGAVTLGAAGKNISATGALAVTGSTVNINGGVAVSTAAPLTVTATGDIIEAASQTITTQGGSVTLNSDSDASGSGAIVLNTSSSITSNGGSITLGGGANPSTDYAQGNSTNLGGILLDTSTSLTSAGGDISLRGKSFATSSGVVTIGVTPAGSIDSGTGSITMDGWGQGTSAANSQGIALSGTLSSTKTNGTAIALTGKSTGSTSSFAVGVNIAGTVQATGSQGGISISGTGGTSSTAGAAPGLLINSTPAGSILASSGPISLTGTAGSGASHVDILMQGGGYIGQKPATSVTSSSSNITLNADSFTVTGTDFVQSSGALTVQPRTAATTIGIAGGAGTLSLPASYFSTNFVNGFSGITIGSATAGTITAGGATTYNDPLTLKSAGSIVLNSSLTGASGQTAHLKLWADADGSGSGAIWMNASSSIATNGGDIVMGGGADPLTGYAVGDVAQAQADGINLSGTSTLTSSGGNISMRGKSAAGSGSVQYLGIVSTGSISSGAGTITLNGISQGSGSGNAQGVALGGTLASANATTGAISVTGSSAGNPVTADWSLGVNSSGTIQATNGGGITLAGTGGNSSAAGGAAGLYVGGNILSNSGPIILTGTAGTQPSGSDISFAFNNGVVGFKAASAVPTSSSNITLNADTLSLGAADVFQSSGALTVQPRTTSFTSAFTYSPTNFVNGFSSVTVGSTNNTGNITTSSAVTASNGGISLLAGGAGGNVTINGSLTAGTNSGNSGTITVKAGADIVVAASQSITSYAQPVVLNSDADASGSGAIVMNTSSSITSNGGSITLGGGANPGSDYAVGSSTNVAGILLETSTSLTSAGGDISLRGKSFAGTGVTAIGIWGSGSIDSGAGSITGDGWGQGTNTNSQGIAITGTLSSAKTNGTAIALTGKSTASTNNIAIGVNVAGTVQATGSQGGISISGTGGTSTLSGQGNGLHINTSPAGSVLASSGPITLTATAGTGATHYDIAMLGGGYIGQKPATSVTSSSSNITLNANSLSLTGTDVVQSSGALTVQPRTTSFSSTFTYSPTNFVNGFSSVTVGSATNAGNITTSSAVTTSNGGISLLAPGAGGTVTINGSLTTGTTSGTSGAITVKAGADIVVAASQAITSYAQPVVLNSDADATSGGAIWMQTNSSITSNGGAVTLSGGLDPTTGFAQGRANVANYANGIFLQNATINSAGGNVTLRGKGATSQNTADTFGLQTDMGIYANCASGACFNLDSGSGKINLYGVSQETTGINAQGIAWISGTITSANTAVDAVTIVGDASLTNNQGWAMGADLRGTIQTTTGGGIAITGTGGTTTGAGATNSHGLVLWGLGNILSNSGAISLTGMVGSGGSGSVDIYQPGFIGQKAATAVLSSSSAITLNANTLTLATTDRLQSSGALTIQPRTTSFTSAFTYSPTNFVNGFSSVAVGSATNAGNITTSSAVTTSNGGISLLAPGTGGIVTINGSLTAGTNSGTSGAITIKAGADIVVAASQSITSYGQPVVFNSAAASPYSDGAIVLNGSNVISTNGGAITLGGGLDPTTGYATGNATHIDGILIQSSSLLSAGGNITVRGKSASAGLGGNGIWGKNTVTIDSGTGAIAIEGITAGNGAAGYNHGFEFNFGGGTTTITSAKTSGTAISLIGDASATGNSGFQGTGVGFFSAGNTVQATGGRRYLHTGPRQPIVHARQ
ncbi:MAG: S-layer family protein, partial [Rhodocyclaceae bacterium]